MNHPSQPRQGSQLYDSLQLQRQRFGVVPTSQSSKEAMQQLYKQQLDSCVYQKSKQKQKQALRQQQEKRQFNEMAEQGKQAERMKDISYKNYYNMLMNSQANNQQTYVSPFAKREQLKDSLVNRAIEEERSRYQDVELETRRKDAEKRHLYKNELLLQIEERRHREYQKKQSQTRQKEQYQANTKAPSELQRYEREKHKDEVAKYRQNLDLMMQGRDRVHSEKGINLAALRPEFHNVLTNPIPYNIQNPYILKEMGAQRNPGSYLATKGSQNLKTT